MNAKQLAKQYGMLSPEEVDLIQRCKLPADAIVINIGANVGTSTIAILEINPNAYVYSVDKRECQEEFDNIKRCELSTDNVERLLGDSTQMDFSFIPYVDLAFIDGGHDDNAVLSDIANIKPLVRVGGYMLFHDYHHPNYRDKPDVNLDDIVDKAMLDWRRVGEARYLVAFQRMDQISVD